MITCQLTFPSPLLRVTFLPNFPLSSPANTLTFSLLPQHYPFLQCNPEIVEHTWTENDEFLVLCSDGLYDRDYVTNEEAVSIVGSFMDRYQLASPCSESTPRSASNRRSLSRHFSMHSPTPSPTMSRTRTKSTGELTDLQKLYDDVADDVRKEKGNGEVTDHTGSGKFEDGDIDDDAQTEVEASSLDMASFQALDVATYLKQRWMENICQSQTISQVDLLKLLPGKPRRRFHDDLTIVIVQLNKSELVYELD
eukprot:TRINITY_DN8785_c0_g1_i1.p1 TRINITY_DN8785_c0_g1~~TRINITY_DN8785_c0_g1_i1.p1  ORF type:complete len:252 (+),score=54.02 TRINITY_DN8785_c0_g1_i1:159-914(+)